jgi:hypothetical protein
MWRAYGTPAREWLANKPTHRVAYVTRFTLITIYPTSVEFSLLFPRGNRRSTSEWKLQRSVSGWHDAHEVVGACCGAIGAILLDVRTVDECSGNGLPGAINIPLAELATRMSELDRSARFVVYCASGNRSGQANTPTTNTSAKTPPLRVQWNTADRLRANSGDVGSRVCVFILGIEQPP